MSPTPPIKAEQSVLGSLIIDNDALLSIKELLHENDFNSTPHKLIFRAIIQLSNAGQPFDFIMLSEHLKKAGLLEDVGGYEYLSILIDNTPTAANISAYANIVREKSLLRRLLSDGHEIIAAIHNSDLAKVETLLQKSISQLAKPEEKTAQKWNDDLSSDIDYMIPDEFVLASDIQKWILSTSIKKQPAIALAATLTILSVVIGRHIHCDGIKGNIINVCLAGSGEGKDHPLKCVDRVLSAIEMESCITAQVASGAALFEAVQRSPSSVLSLDEIGHYFSGITGKGSNQYSKEIMPMITEMYTSANYQYRDKSRAGRQGEIIREPNLSVIGMTTERQIIDNLRTGDMEDGSLARFLVYFGANNVPINQDIDFDNRAVPASIIEGLLNLQARYGCDATFMNSKPLDISSGYRQLKNELMIYYNNKAIECGKEHSQKSIAKPLYARILVKAVSISLLIDQCQSERSLRWAANLCEEMQRVFIMKFLHMAHNNENERLVKIIECAIKEAGENGLTKSVLYEKTKQVPSMQKTLILNDLIDSDKVFTRTVNLNGSRKGSLVYYWKE